EIILSEAHCQANRGINALSQSNFVSYLSFFSFGFLPAFFVYFFGEGTPEKTELGNYHYLIECSDCGYENYQKLTQDSNYTFRFLGSYSVK
ncbi:MAG: hypothetical protein IJ598_07575, partial [Ruminococcus sp.]|nr:hypothetical protein [Ruminococcus sp.]